MNYPTAIDGGDYQSGPYTAMIPAGSTSASFDVNITDDNIYELPPQTFHLTIAQTSEPFLAILTTRGQITVIIVDDDRKLFVINWIATSVINYIVLCLSK